MKSNTLKKTVVETFAAEKTLSADMFTGRMTVMSQSSSVSECKLATADMGAGESTLLMTSFG